MLARLEGTLKHNFSFHAEQRLRSRLSDALISFYHQFGGVHLAATWTTANCIHSGVFSLSRSLALGCVRLSLKIRLTLLIYWANVPMTSFSLLFKEVFFKQMSHFSLNSIVLFSSFKCVLMEFFMSLPLTGIFAEEKRNFLFCHVCWAVNFKLEKSDFFRNSVRCNRVHNFRRKCAMHPPPMVKVAKIMLTVKQLKWHERKKIAIKVEFSVIMALVKRQLNYFVRWLQFK